MNTTYSAFFCVRDEATAQNERHHQQHCSVTVEWVVRGCVEVEVNRVVFCCFYFYVCGCGV